MKDFDDLLATSYPRPRRPLRAEFTKEIVNHISQPRHKLAYIKELLTMKLTHKPLVAAAALIALLAFTTTAYATGGFGFLNAFFQGVEEMPSGDRIVKVETKDCVFVDAITVLKERGNSATYYYKVKKDSKLTDEQITAMVQAECDIEKRATATPNLNEELIRLNPANKDALVGGYLDNKIVAISPTHLTIEFEYQHGQTMQKVTQTTPIDPQVIVQDGPTRLSLKDVKPGDRITLTYRATGNALARSESQTPGSNSHENTIVAIYKNSHTLSDAITTQAMAYQKYHQREFERVEPCPKDKNPSGYCSLEEYYRK